MKRGYNTIYRQTIEWIVGGVSSFMSRYSVPVNFPLLIKAIEEDISNIWSPRVIKAFILELHQAKDGGLLKGNTSEARYDYFVQELSKQANLDFFLKRYPVIKNKLNLFKEHYLNSIKQLLKHLDQDLEQIKKKVSTQ